MALQFTVANFVNLFAFAALTIATYTIFYFGRRSEGNQVSLSLFTLSFGINFIGLSHLFRIWAESVLPTLIIGTLAIGAVSTVIGVFLVFYRRSSETENLKKREDEIKSIIAKLRDKYYEQELSEEDLKTAYSGLLKELAEIEVRLAGRKPKIKKA